MPRGKIAMPGGKFWLDKSSRPGPKILMPNADEDLRRDWGLSFMDRGGILVYQNEPLPPNKRGWLVFKAIRTKAQS